MGATDFRGSIYPCDTESGLTDAIRAYLAAARAGKYLLERVVRELQEHFGLTAKEAGAVIAQDVRERP